MTLTSDLVSVIILSKAYPTLFEVGFVCLFVCCPLSTAMVIAGRSVHLTTLFPGQAVNQ